MIAVAYGFARYGYGLFVPIFREKFGLSTEVVGIISSAGYVAYLSAMILTGFLVGRVGPRFPVVFGAMCAGTGMLLISVSQSPLVLVVGIILAGSSAGFCWSPFSDAVAMLVEESRRDRVLSAVSTGTTFGLIVAGPVVLLAGAGGGAGWRYAWAAFALAAMLSALWNFRLLPNEPYGKSDAGAGGGIAVPRVGWFLCRESAPLLGQAFSYGLVAAFYYTYAVDLVRRSGFEESWGPILWSLVGVAGVTGVFSGEVVSRFGLRRSLTACLSILSVAVVALTFSENFRVLVAICALTFGAAYMPVSAFLIIWSGRVFHKNPSAGFSGVLFCLALGSIAGPAILGAVAGTLDLRSAFWCAAALTAFSIALRPK
ncbi:MAG: YbfB/YjiJ family MFS transporter [Rubrobacter sp.]|nr:YbfB/YjiJ family MFS transporter [Rubrobacter sp.]